MNYDVQFSDLAGQTLAQVDVSEEQIDYHTLDGAHYRQYHMQECCEYVRIEEVVGEWDDLIGLPLLEASEVSNEDDPPELADLCTWTFYILRTNRGTVVVRWLGESNGYYSERVDFVRLK